MFGIQTAETAPGRITSQGYLERYKLQVSTDITAAGEQQRHTVTFTEAGQAAQVTLTDVDLDCLALILAAHQAEILRIEV